VRSLLVLGAAFAWTPSRRATVRATPAGR
jgi:hypothetical protein